MRVLLVLLLVSQGAWAHGQGIQGTGSATTDQGPDAAGPGLLELIIDVLGASEAPSVEQPRWDSLESPRHALLTFFEAMEHALEGKEKGWERALGVLGDSGEEARVEATLLQEVFVRLGRPEPFHLPGTGMVEERELRRFQYFPAAHHDWVWDRLEEPPRGRIELVLDEAGEWRFSPGTLDGVQELWDTTAALPPRYEARAARAKLTSLLGPDWRENSLLDAMFALGSILISMVLAWLLRWLVRIARRWGERKDHRVLVSILQGLEAPLALACVATGLATGLGFLHLGGLSSGVLHGLVRLLYITAGGWFLLSIVGATGSLLQRFGPGEEGPLGTMLAPMITKTVRVVTLILVLVVVLESVFGVNITGFLAGIGLIGLAISLAAKDSLQNVFGALTIYLDQPFRVGDLIRFQGSFGTVEEIGLRATTLRLLGGDIVYQPNMAFIEHKVENVSLRPHIRRVMDLGLRYDTPAEKVEEAVGIVESLLREGPLPEDGHFDLEATPPRVSFSGFEESTLNLKVYYWYGIDSARESGWFEFLEHCQQVNLEILRRFEEAGILLAFPTRTIVLSREAEQDEEVEEEGLVSSRAAGASTEPVDPGEFESESEDDADA